MKARASSSNGPRSGFRERMIYASLVWLICGSVLSAFELIIAYRSGFSGTWEDYRFFAVYFTSMMMIYLGAAVGALILGLRFNRRRCRIRRTKATIGSAVPPAATILAVWFFLHGVNWLDESYPYFRIISFVGAVICAAIFILSFIISIGFTLFAKGVTVRLIASEHHKLQTVLIALIAAAMTLMAKAPFESATRKQSPEIQHAPLPELNVVLVIVDTLRADRWDPSHSASIRSPNIDRLSREGTQVTEMVCQMPTTGPSHASFMTSLYPRTHGLKANGHVLDNTWDTLAEILGKRGYRTAAFVSSIALAPMACGLDQGFDSYTLAYSTFSQYLFSNRLCGARLYEKFIMRVEQSYECRADQTNQAIFKWLDLYRDSRFFLWAHYWDPHEDYDPPPPYHSIYDSDYRGIVNGTIEQNREFSAGRLPLSPADRRHLAALYDGEVAFLNYHIDQLIDTLNQQALLENSLIILTADHGESLGEHNFIGHSRVLYDQALRIPLILYCPSLLDVSVIQKQIQSIDLLPTILDLLEVPVPPGIQGTSFLPLLRGTNQHWTEEAYGERRYYRGLDEDAFFVRTPLWKYIASSTGEERLYSLVNDPGETNDVASQYTNQLTHFRGRLEQWKRSTPCGRVEKRGEISEEVREKLKTLGYTN